MAGDPLTRERALPARALTALANFQALIDDLDQSSEIPLDELTEHAIRDRSVYHRSERASGAIPRRIFRAGHRNAPYEPEGDN